MFDIKSRVETLKIITMITHFDSFHKQIDTCSSRIPKSSVEESFVKLERAMKSSNMRVKCTTRAFSFSQFSISVFYPFYSLCDIPKRDHRTCPAAVAWPQEKHICQSGAYSCRSLRLGERRSLRTRP